MNKKELELLQKRVCEKYSSVYLPAKPDLKMGISLNVRGGIKPLNGLRHPPEKDTTGWYIWGGEKLSRKSDFFKPLHATHIKEWCPAIQKFLGLEPGWRFLIADDYTDVWFDPSLLELNTGKS